MSFPAYPNYRESGVEWLGAIPTDWQVRKFRHTFRESDEKIESEVVGPMLSVSGYRGIEIKDYDDENRRRSDEDLIGYRIVRPGQLVVNTMWLNYAGLGVSEHEGHVSPAYRAYWFADENADRRFIHHLMRSSAYVLAYTQLLTGIRPNSLQMSRADLMDFPIVLPPQSTQRAIAAFLDRETAKIDALIEEQRRLVALLKEKRQAIISHAVTKGLDPRAPMKDSGIDWLGDVPAHWKIVSAKRVAAIFVPQRNKPDLNESSDGLPWVTMEDMEKIDIADTRMYVSQQAAEMAGCRPLPANSVVASCVGNFGSAAINRRPVYINQQIQGYIVQDVIIPEFLRIVVAASTGHFEKIATAATLPYVNQQGFANMPVPLPPLTEQQEIAAYQKDSAAKIDMLLTTVAEAVLLLNERRSALISAAVTGKIDVRETAAAEDRKAA